MPFHIKQTVRITERDPIRGGETAIVKEVLPPRHGVRSGHEYLLEFRAYPKKVRLSEDRFLFCIYREEQLTGED